MRKKDDPFTPDSVLTAGIDHSDLLVELPITIRNSRLMNSLMCELDTKNKEPDKMQFLGLSARLVCRPVTLIPWGMLLIPLNPQMWGATYRQKW